MGASPYSHLVCASTRSMYQYWHASQIGALSPQSTERVQGLLLRICITCDRYVDRVPTSGERLAQAATDALVLRPELDISVLRVACLNGCKLSCQTMLTGREPVRIGGLKPEDAGFLVEIAAVYCSGGEVFDMVSKRSSELVS
jgi:predicted metal-binding protein